MTTTLREGPPALDGTKTLQPVCTAHSWRGVPSIERDLAKFNLDIHLTDFHPPEPALFELS